MHTSSTPSPSSPPCKRRFACGQCDRTFTTGGHLARHTRVHTGERNHKCPFPGCETRCSRQDNLQQHYRIHLSPGSRRTSGAATRAAMNKQAGLNATRTKRSRTPPPPLVSAVPVTTDGPDSPITRPDPPNTPPPLVDAYTSQPPGSVSSHSSARSTPELAYAYAQPGHHALHPPSRASHSPDATYSPSQPHATGGSSYWNHHRYEKSEYQYGYSDEPASSSPSSSPNNQYSSPQSPYTTSSKYDSGLARPSRHGMSQSATSPVDPISPTAAHPPTHSYSQSYTQGVPTSSPLTHHDSTGSASSYTLAGYSTGSRGTHGEGQPTSSSAAQLAYPTPSSYYAQASAPTRFPSPPVTLAPIQTDRLARGSEQLPTLSSTTSTSSVQYPSVPNHSHHHTGSASHLAQRSNSVPHLEVAHYSHVQQQQQQQHASSQHASYDHYSYSNMSSNGGNASWRPDSFRRNSIQAV